jgi:hypothetical protein
LHTDVFDHAKQCGPMAPVRHVVSLPHPTAIVERQTRRGLQCAAGVSCGIAGAICSL